MPDRDNLSSISEKSGEIARRRLLGCIAAAPAVLALPALPTAATADPLEPVWQELLALGDTLDQRTHWALLVGFDRAAAALQGRAPMDGCATVAEALGKVPGGDDAAVIAAFQRWLATHNEMHAAPSDAALEESYSSYLEAVYAVMELPAVGAVGMALKGYVVLNEELSGICGPAGRHGASLVLPTAEDSGPLPARIVAGLLESCCRIVPELRRFATATRGDVLTLAGGAMS